MKKLTQPLLALAVLMGCVSTAFAHVSLEQGIAEAGSPYKAIFRVGHGCDGAATTAVTVRLPAGFEAAKALPRPGWTVQQQDASITWTAANAQAGLPATERGEFVLSGKVPAKPGPLWFKVLQTCGQANVDWAQVPAGGTSTAGLNSPAALLQVMSTGDFVQAQAVPKVEAAWVRSSVPGQQGTGAFMKITAQEAMQIVGVSTPVAGTAEVHEMKMDGDVMRMRAVPKLDLPAGKAVELKPGGYHVMLLDLKQPLAAGSTVPLTLVLRNAKGVESKLDLKLPVTTQPAGAHKH